MHCIVQNLMHQSRREKRLNTKTTQLARGSIWPSYVTYHHQICQIWLYCQRKNRDVRHRHRFFPQVFNQDMYTFCYLATVNIVAVAVGAGVGGLLLIIIIIIIIIIIVCGFCRGQKKKVCCL